MSFLLTWGWEDEKCTGQEYSRPRSKHLAMVSSALGLVPANWPKTSSCVYDNLASKKPCIPTSFSSDWTPENTKTKGALMVVYTPTLKSNLGLRNIKKALNSKSSVCVFSLCVTSRQNCIYCYVCCYPLYTLRFPPFSLTVIRFTVSVP